MTNLFYIILLSITLLCPIFSDAASSTNFKLDGAGTVSSSGSAASPSYSNSGIAIGRSSAFLSYTGASMKSSSYTFIPAATTTTRLKLNSTAPAVSSFIIGVTSNLTVPVLSFVASGNAGLAGYLITESSATPSAGMGGWSASVPTSYTYSSYGSKPLYGWVKDLAGNVSAAKTATVSLDGQISSPVITVNSVPIPYYGKSITLSGTCSDITGISSISVTKGTAAPVNAMVGNGTWIASIPGLLPGTNAIMIDAVNNIGNHSTSTLNVVVGLHNLTIVDALRILKIAVGKIAPTAADLTNYDLAPYVNGRSKPDGKIDIRDALVALKIVVGAIY